MKKVLLLASVISLIMYIPAISNNEDNSGGLELLFHFGLSTPNDQVNNIYNSNTLKGENVIGRLYRDGVALGYHLGLGIRYPLSDDFKLIGGIAWNRFPQSEIRVEDPANNNALLVTLQSVQNVIPIHAGISYYPIVTDLLRVYGTGELSYNYISNSTDYENVPLNMNLNKSPDNRAGFGIGAGIDIDISLVVLNLEVKYNMMNLIGKNDTEKTKAYYTLSLGVLF